VTEIQDRRKKKVWHQRERISEQKSSTTGIVVKIRFGDERILSSEGDAERLSDLQGKWAKKIQVPSKREWVGMPLESAQLSWREQFGFGRSFQPSLPAIVGQKGLLKANTSEKWVRSADAPTDVKNSSRRFLFDVCSKERRCERVLTRRVKS